MASNFNEYNKRITAAYVTQFHDSFEILAQQKQSRLLNTIHNRGKITGNSFTINDMGTLEMQDNIRFGETEWNLPDAGTRRVFLEDKNLAVPIAKVDVPKMLASVQGPYMNACLYAYQRKVDEIIYKAMLDKIQRVDEYNGTPKDVVLPNTQVILHGGKPLSKDKIIAAKAIFRSNECDEQNGEQIYMLYDSTMLIQILGESTLTSADFMSIKMLQEGAVGTKWCGVIWVPYEKLLTGTESGGAGGKTQADVTYKRTVMYTSSAIHYGQGAAYGVDIGPRRDKNNTIQIYVDASMAAGRANEQKVVEIQTI